MKKKLLLGLLVVLMVGILAFSVFACQHKNDGKDKNDKDKTDDTTKPVETTLDVKAGPMINDLIASINNTAKVATNIEDAASVNVDLYVDVEIGETTVNVKLNVAGSVDAGTNANNWATISANVQGVQVGLFAEKNSAGNEYLYIGQNILNEDVVWSKLSQAENANLLSGTPAEEFTDANENDAYDEGEEYVDANENGAYDGEKFGVVPELFELIASIDANTEAKLNAGIINTKEGILSTIMGVVPMVGKLLFAPIDGVTNIEEIDEITFETDLSSADGYAARLNIEDLSAVIGGLGPVLDTLLKDDDGNKMDLTPYQPIVNMVVPIILGGQFNLSDFTFTPGTAVPEIQLLVDINSDKTFGGLHLSYEHDVDLDATDSEPAQHVKVAFGLDNVSFKATSATKPSAIVNAVADAEELAINLGLDIELEAIAGGYANLDLNVYPNVSLGWDEDGYLALDLSKLYAEVLMTYDTVEGDYVQGQYVEEVVTKTDVIAQYNADGNEDIILNLSLVAEQLGASAGIYKIPVNLSEKYADFIAEQKAGEAVVVENAGLADDIIGIVSGIINKPEDQELDIVGLVMNIAGKLGTVVEEVTALGAFINEGTIDVEGLIAALLADDGLIGESTAPIYIDGEAIVLGEIADQVTTDQVLGTIAGLANVEVADIIGLVADFTGATLDADDAYANMAISATGYAHDGIGATITAVLGADDSTAEISIGLSAAIIENKTEYEDVLGAADFYEYESTAIANGEFITFSNNTGRDGGKGLLNAVKGIFNSIVSNDKFHLDTFEAFWGTVITDNYTEVCEGSYAYAEEGYGMSLIISALDAPAGSTVTIYNNANGVSVAQMVMDTNYMPARPVPGTPVVFAENEDQASFIVEGEDGLMFYILGNEGTVVEFGINIAVAEEGGDEVAVPDGAIALVIGENTTGAFAYGLGGTNTYFYTYTATEDCTLSFTYSEGHFVGAAENGMMGWIAYMPFNNDQIELVAGQTIVIAVENQIYDDETGDRDASAVTFTASVAVNG